MALTNVRKNSILDVARVVDLLLSLLGENLGLYLKLFIRKAHRSVSKSVLCKIVTRKDIASNEKFQALTTYRQVLIFVEKYQLEKICVK